ncbi:MAG: hypothetical protein IKV46_02970 [Bacteroidales bacterium]|nr:hypothetical protein [Bacteroidales bacterium]
MEPKESLKQFVEINNGHPCDDVRFYEIVFETIENQLEELDFREVMTDEEFERYFPRYEDLISFAKYMQKRNN